MWMYQTIESKYYEFGDLDTESKFNIYKNFIKGLIGTKTFAYCTFTSNYIKVADDVDYTENVLTIRTSDVKDLENWELSYGEYTNCRFTSDGYTIKIKPEGASGFAYIEYGNLDFTEASKVMYKARNLEYGNTDLTLKLIELYYNYILPKYGVNYIWLIEEDSNYDKQFKALIYKITNFVNSTYKYYSPLIDAYLVNESHLLDKIQTIVENEASSGGSGTSVSLQNDTPGELNEGYDATHTSFATKDTSSNSSSSSSTATYSKDVEPLIDKLNRIRTKYTDLYTEWADRFESILCGFNF